MILIALTLLAADPSTFSGVMASAHPGDTIRLVAGHYAKTEIKSRVYDPPVTIDASNAQLDGIQLVGSSGITWNGGTFKGDITVGGANYAISASLGSAITVNGIHASDYRTGIVFDRITGGTVSGNWLARMSSDGIDVAASRNIAVAHNACSDFYPAEGAHPDCIQLWSVPGIAPTADVTITANSVVGTMQGISLFNHVNDGIDQGGFDRINIANNTVLITFGDGISMYSCRGCTARNNSVNSLPNYSNRAQLYVSDGSVDQCGNDVTMVPRQSTPPCTTQG